MPALITSRTNPRLKQLRAAIEGHARLSGGLIAIEGEHLLDEALASGQAIKTVFVAEGRALPRALPASLEVIEVSSELFRSVCETETPQGIAALLVPPVWTIDAILEAHAAPLLVIAVGLQDPGNLGTLIRSAEAFGATGVLLTAGTVSPWNGKCLRASAGAVFRMPVVTVNDQALDLLRARGVRLLATVPSPANSADVAVTDLLGPCALVIGNEGAGLPAAWLDRADAHITIPCPGRVESLNAAVAASILLYESSRQRTAGELRAPGALP